jgi:hypothetical protein
MESGAYTLPWIARRSMPDNNIIEQNMAELLGQFFLGAVIQINNSNVDKIHTQITFIP